MRLRSVIVAFLFLGLMGQDLCAQKIFERKRPEIFPLNGRYKLSGYFGGVGATYMLTRFTDTEEELFSNQDSSYSVTFDPNGGFGVYLEGGWFKVFKYSSIVRFMDVGLAYKQLKGSEAYRSKLEVESMPVQEFENEGAFNESFLTFNLNFSNLLQLGDRTFLQNSLGANVDYRLTSSIDPSVDYGLHDQQLPGDLRAQIHYKLGFGWKLSSKVIMVPSLETPILSVHEWDDGRSDFQYFSSRYRPIIFSVRFMFLRPAGKGMDCVPVKHTKRPKSKEYKPDSYHP